MSDMLVILNPVSGRGNATRSKDALSKALRRAALPFEMVQTEEPGHAIHLARRARLEGYSVVVAAGGDGTISEVVNGLMQAHATRNGGGAGEPAGPLGVIPVGSGNDFASMIGIARDFDQAAAALARNQVRRIDLGRARLRPVRESDAVTQRYFDNNMGIGLEAAVTLESYKLRRMRGMLLYATAALRTLAKHKSPRMQVHWASADGERGELTDRIILVSVGNSPRAGGGFYLTPDASMDDEYFDVALATDLPRPAILALLPRAMVGKHTNHRAVTMLRVQTLRVTVPEGAPVQMDGEVVAEQATQIEIEVLPGALDVIV